MKAIVGRRFAKPDALRVANVEKPSVTEDTVVVRVHATSANPVDLFLPKPTILGHDFAGTIEAVGAHVTAFKPGDEVFGEATRTYVEFARVPADGKMVRKPASVSFEDAASLPVAGCTALQAVRDHGGVQVGQRVLVNGASGGVGTFSVQLAKSFGAHVTAVCSSGNVEMAAAIGADRVIDYAQEDFSAGGERYDLLIDIAGSRSWSRCWRVIEPNGTFVAVGSAAVQYRSSWRGLGHLAGTRLASFGRRRATRFFITKVRRADLETLVQLVDSGVVKPVIDRHYSLDEAGAALGYLSQGHAAGKIVISTV